MKKLIGVLLFGVLLLLAACGNNVDKSAKAEGSKEKEPTSALESVKEKGKIVIGTTGNYRPFSYMDSSNKLIGYDIEWGNIIAEELGVKAEFTTGQFAGLIPGLVANKFDILLSGVNVTEERLKSIVFTEHYAVDGAVAVVQKDNKDIGGIEDLGGRIVGVNAGSAFEEVVKNIGTYKEVKTYPGAAESFMDLTAGRVDLIAIGLPAAAEYINNSVNGNQLKIVGDTFDKKDIAVAAKPGNEDLIEAINEIIKKKKEDGTYDKLAMKYFGMTFD
ncbi:substrate-binding periplasmic protein [Solibacillus sp. FSL K6-1523]|uniref:substrate-binding periplasmic protein n=1 Tax=Solibacillus sp. FSL K6-1523 TaxID=2921471 RepID=UPI0030F80299